MTTTPTVVLPGKDFNLSSSATRAVLAELVNGGSESQCVGDLAMAAGVAPQTVRSLIPRLVAAQWAREWYSDEVVAAQQKKTVRRYVALDEHGIREARRALERYEPTLGDDDTEPGTPADIAKRLGELLLAVQQRSGLTGADLAAHVGRTQSWWSKLTTGRARSIDLDSLDKAIAKLSPPPQQAQRIIELARAVNAADTLPRLVFSRAGSRLYEDWEAQALRRARQLLILSPDTIPIQLWCNSFAQAMASGLPPRQADALLSSVSRWRSRIASKRVRITWAVGEAALYRTYGLARDVVAEQLEHMESAAVLSPGNTTLLLGIVPFDAETRDALPALRIVDEKSAALDLATGLVKITGREVSELVRAFREFPVAWADEAEELLRRAQMSHT